MALAFRQRRDGSMVSKATAALMAAAVIFIYRLCLLVLTFDDGVCLYTGSGAALGALRAVTPTPRRLIIKYDGFW